MCGIAGWFSPVAILDAHRDQLKAVLRGRAVRRRLHLDGAQRQNDGELLHGQRDLVRVTKRQLGLEREAGRQVVARDLDHVRMD